MCFMLKGRRYSFLCSLIQYCREEAICILVHIAYPVTNLIDFDAMFSGDVLNYTNSDSLSVATII